MNNIFGQPNNYNGCHQNSYTRPCHHSQVEPIQEDCRRVQPIQEECRRPRPIQEECRQECGTVLRINIPAGAEINILNLVELASPEGICLILRLPFLAGECKPC